MYVGISVEDRLRELGVTRGVVADMARKGQLLEVICEMPTCYCPHGRSAFSRTNENKDWALNKDHYPVLRSKGGYKEAANIRLSHVLCNREDASIRTWISRRLTLGESLDTIAKALNRKKRPPPIDLVTWTPTQVRRALVS
jgi:hypothetical protein